ncbi:MAG: microcompartment protein [Caproiciproducens sp.]|nr:microcompartment protein [Caproiciproducens sp.]
MIELDAIGVVEISFFANAVVILDAMLKSSDVELADCQKKLGGKLVQVVIKGSTSAVESAMESARSAGEIVGEKNIKVAVTISNPHPEILKLLKMIT